MVEQTPQIQLLLNFEPIELSIDNREKLIADINELFPNNSHLEIYRSCDGCKCRVGESIDSSETVHQCKICNKKFDLCIECQYKLEKDECPGDYGCKDNDPLTLTEN